MLNLAVMLPIAAGLLLLALRPKRRGPRELIVMGATLITSVLVLASVLRPSAEQSVLLYLLPNLPLAFRLDGVGRVMLAWAEDFARARGKAFLRLDSQRVNRPLSRYYEALGYRAAGTCVEGTYEGILREKPLVPAIET